LEEARIHEIIRAQVSDRSRDIVEEVERAAAEHDLGVVGMKTNPHPKRAAGALKKAGIAYKCLEYGGYTGSWRRRNALKMWTGSPYLADGVRQGNADWRRTRDPFPNRLRLATAPAG